MPHPLTAKLLSSRSTGTVIVDLSNDLVPHDIASAYAIQNETIAALGPVAAWKVAPMPAHGDPTCSPILQANVYRNGAKLKRKDFPGLAIEAEVAVRLGRDLGDGSYRPSKETVVAAIESLHVAIEIVASRYANRASVPALAATADLQNAGGIVLGPPHAVPSLPEFSTLPLELKLGSDEIRVSQQSPSTENALASIGWLAQHAFDRGLPLKAGVVIITGARIGPLSFSAGEVEVASPELGTVRTEFS